MPKGQAPRIKEPICNIPVQEIETNCSISPRTPNSNEVVIVKLKIKIQYKDYAVTTEIVAK